jgi:hypothetical protein
MQILGYEVKGHMPSVMRKVFPKTAHAPGNQAPTGQREGVRGNAQTGASWKTLGFLKTRSLDAGGNGGPAQTNAPPLPITHAAIDELPGTQQKDKAVVNDEPLPQELQGPNFGALVASLSEDLGKPLNREQKVAIGNLFAKYGTVDGKAPSIEFILSTGGDPRTQFDSTVDSAIVVGFRPAFKLALDLADLGLIDINKRNLIGQTYLHQIADSPSLLSSDWKIPGDQGTAATSSDAQTVGVRERVTALLARGADLTIRTGPGIYGNCTYENPLHTAVSANNLDFINAIADSKQSLNVSHNKRNILTQQVHQALHTHDANYKIPAAYAKSKEMVDAAVALGTQKNYVGVISNGKVVYPPYVWSENEAVANAWMAHAPETDYGRLMKSGMYNGMSVVTMGFLKTPAIVNVLCHPQGPLGQTEFSKVNYNIHRTALHCLDNADVVRAYIEQIRAGGGEKALKEILNVDLHDGTSFEGPPLATVRSYEVAEVLLRAGASVDNRTINYFKNNNAPDVHCTRYDETLKLLENALNEA